MLALFMRRKVANRRDRKTCRPSPEALEVKVVMSSTTSANLATTAFHGHTREAGGGQPVIGMISGRVVNESNTRGLHGVRIQLIDADGNVVKTTATNARGQYQFRVRANGPYVVREVTPRNFVQMSPTFANRAPE